MEREGDVRQAGWLRALRPIPALAALGVVLGGCACCGPRHYGDTERAVGYQPGTNPDNSPDYRRSVERELARGGRGR